VPKIGGCLGFSGLTKYLNSDEVMSDAGWIAEYIRKEWNNVARWLSNIDNSLREMWSQYIKQIIENKKKEMPKLEGN